MKIGEVACQFNLSADTLRYYDKIGLLKPPRKNGVRDYQTQDLDTLDSIIKLKKAGFSLHEIRHLLTVDRVIVNYSRLNEKELKEIIELEHLITEKITANKAQIELLKSINGSLAKMADKLSAVSRTGKIPLTDEDNTRS